MTRSGREPETFRKRGNTLATKLQTWSRKNVYSHIDKLPIFDKNKMSYKHNVSLYTMKINTKLVAGTQHSTHRLHTPRSGFHIQIHVAEYGVLSHKFVARSIAAVKNYIHTPQDSGSRLGGTILFLSGLTMNATTIIFC